LGRPRRTFNRFRSRDIVVVLTVTPVKSAAV